MSNLAAAWANIAVNGTLTASSAATAMPVTLLQQEDVSRHWRSAAGTTAYFDLTFGSTQSADAFAILGTNLSATGTIQIKLSNTAAGNTDVWDSGAVSVVDPNYEDAIILASSVKSGWKYCRVILTDATKSYMEAGFLFIGTRAQFTYNYAYGAQRTVVDPSEHKKTRGGQTKIIARPKFRQWDIPVDFVNETDRWSLIEAMDLANGISTPVLLILDPASTNLGRDSIFGLIQQSDPVGYVQAFDSGGQVYSRTYRIEERL